MSAAMLPARELCPGEHGHLFARGLEMAHMDSALRGNAAAQEFLASRAERARAARGVDAAHYRVPRVSCSVSHISSSSRSTGAIAATGTAGRR